MLFRSAWVTARFAYGAVALLCWIPQMAEWKIIYGKLVTMPQANGFIQFPPRYIPDVLFSTLNGWFIWTPAVLIGAVGLILATWRWPRTVLPWLVVISLELMVLGSMPTNWWGGWSFGQRSLTSSVPLMAWGIAICFLLAAPFARKALAVALAVCCLFTMTFAAQYRLHLIQREDRLTFQELVLDKFRLGPVIRRESAVRQATAMLQQGSVDGAALTLEAAARQSGENSILLEALVATYRQKGDAGKADAAQERLRRLSLTRLW